jgi:hypothetical protein
LIPSLSGTFTVTVMAITASYNTNATTIHARTDR